MIRSITLLIVLLIAACSPQPPLDSAARNLQNPKSSKGRNADLAAELKRIDLHIISHDTHSRFFPAVPVDENSPGGRKYSANEQIEELIKKLTGLGSGVERIALLSHGGLNTFTKSRESAEEICRQMIKESDGKIFPIFITWRSGLLATYKDSIFYERAGFSNRKNGLRGVSEVEGLALRFPSDLLTGIARLPKTVPTSVGNVLQNWDFLYQVNPELYPAKHTFYSTINNVFAHGAGGIKPQWKGGFDNAGKDLTMPDPGRVPESPWYKTSLGKTVDSFDFPLTAYNIALSPVKLATLGPVDSIGRPAWENMTKRTRVLVRRDGAGEGPNESVETAMSVLIGYMANMNKSKRYQIEIYGHSMGSMVFNEVVREINEGRLPDPGINLFVYMAAACSISDFNATVGIYLQKHKESHFSNLCLHPDAEVREIYASFGNVAVSGSLLVWIDSYYESPRSRLDRTLGSYLNVINSWQYLPHSENMTIKAFGMQHRSAAAAGWPNSGGYNAGPQTHGQFNDFHFWKKDYQEIKPRDVMPKYVRFR